MFRSGIGVTSVGPGISGTTLLPGISHASSLLDVLKYSPELQTFKKDKYVGSIDGMKVLVRDEEGFFAQCVLCEIPAQCGQILVFSLAGTKASAWAALMEWVKAIAKGCGYSSILATMNYVEAMKEAGFKEVHSFINQRSGYRVYDLVFHVQ